MAKTRRILCLTTGGTIGGHSVSPSSGRRLRKRDLRPLDGLRRQWGIDVRVAIAAVRGPDGEPVDLDSSNIEPRHWTYIAETIAHEYDSYDGFVILHGTNTIAYTSAAMSFAIANSAKPIVMTGSQIDAGRPGSDAATNVQNAIKLAVHPRVEIGGVVCLFGTHILTGTRAKKTTDFGMDAITTVGATATLARIGRTLTVHDVNLTRHQGYLARNGGVAKRRRDLQVRTAFDLTGIVSVTEFPGQDLTLMADLACRTAAKAVVIRAFGSGDVSKAHQRSLKVLKEAGIPVMVGTQVPNGNAHQTANRPGRQVRRKSLGVPMHDMSNEAMTAKLGWLLGQGIDGDALRQAMIRDLRGEITVATDLHW